MLVLFYIYIYIILDEVGMNSVTAFHSQQNIRHLTFFVYYWPKIMIFIVRVRVYIIHTHTLRKKCVFVKMNFQNYFLKIYRNQTDQNNQ